MATIQYRLAQKKQANGTAELLVRFNTSRHTSYRAKSRIYVPFEAWNQTEQRIVLSHRLNPLTRQILDTNTQISALTSHIFSSWQRDQYYSTSLEWLQHTIDGYHRITTKKVTLYDKLMEYAGEHTYSTAKGIYTCARSIEQFRPSIPIASVNVDFVKSYAEYLLSTHSPNSTKKMLSILRAVCRRAVYAGLLTHSPFEGQDAYHIGTQIYGSPQYLSVDERDYLTSFDGLPANLAVQRDIFIFQCHCGCRVSDLNSLTIDNIVKDSDGNYWLQYIPHKTISVKATTIRVPLSDVAVDIVNRYRHTRQTVGYTSGTHHYEYCYVDDANYNSNKLLPFISDQKYNEAIHNIFTIAGLTRPVMVLDRHTGQPTTTTLDAIATSHIARKTFSQHIYSLTHSDRITASFTGHSPNSRAFMRYNEVTDEIKLSTIQSVPSSRVGTVTANVSQNVTK